jgi:hypothetical protein
VKKRSQLATKPMGKKTFTKRNKESGQFMGRKKKAKFKVCANDPAFWQIGHTATIALRQIALDLTAIARADLLHEIDDPMANRGAGYPHERLNES